jgi:hypothetical protein
MDRKNTFIGTLTHFVCSLVALGRLKPGDTFSLESLGKLIEDEPDNSLFGNDSGIRGSLKKPTFRMLREELTALGLLQVKNGSTSRVAVLSEDAVVSHLLGSHSFLGHSFLFLGDRVPEHGKYSFLAPLLDTLDFMKKLVEDTSQVAQVQFAFKHIEFSIRVHELGNFLFHEPLIATLYWTQMLIGHKFWANPESAQKLKLLYVQSYKDALESILNKDTPRALLTLRGLVFKLIEQFVSLKRARECEMFFRRVYLGAFDENELPRLESGST